MEVRFLQVIILLHKHFFLDAFLTSQPKSKEEETKLLFVCLICCQVGKKSRKVFLFPLKNYFQCSLISLCNSFSILLFSRVEIFFFLCESFSLFFFRKNIRDGKFLMENFIIYFLYFSTIFYT
jgi:hypothetical protein